MRQPMSPALKFVLMVGVMSLFADFTYEGSRSITGQYLQLLGAGPLAIGIITGFGEFLGYGLRLFSGRAADRTGMYWPITIGGYILQMTVVPLLEIAQEWRVAGLLIILERVGKATRSPPRNAMLSHAAKHIGYGWAFGVHEALDQLGALFGPLLVALVLMASHDDYRLAFALLAIPDAIMLSLLAVARLLYPRPQDLEGGSTSARADGLPRSFWVYLLAAAALMATGFANFPIIAYHFQHSGTVSVALIPIFYGVASAVAGIGSLVFGRFVVRTAGVFGGFVPNLAGTCLWGLGMGVHESIILVMVTTMVAPDRRASAYGLFTCVYGAACFIGSTAIGALFNVSLVAVVTFAVVAELSAIPLVLIVYRLTMDETLTPGT